MAYFNECPDCGAALDPGEQCDCKKEKAASAATEHGKECATIKKHISILHERAGFVK